MIGRAFVFARKVIKNEINLLLKEVDELAKILGSSISSLKGKKQF